MSGLHVFRQVLSHGTVEHIAKETFIKEKAGKPYFTTKFDNVEKTLKKLETWIAEKKQMMLQKQYKEIMNDVRWIESVDQTERRTR